MPRDVEKNFQLEIHSAQVRLDYCHHVGLLLPTSTPTQNTSTSTVCHLHMPGLHTQDRISQDTLNHHTWAATSCPISPAFLSFPKCKMEVCWTFFLGPCLHFYELVFCPPYLQLAYLRLAITVNNSVMKV